jgi:hypothetical protein
MYFEYILEMRENLYVCVVEDVIGISELNFETAIEDATQKLYYNTNLVSQNKYNTSNIIKINIDDYNSFHKNQAEHIFW